MPHLDLNNVSVRYRIYDVTRASLKSAAIEVVGGRVKGDDNRVSVSALKDVTVNLRTGDRLGVLGHNGAGKTTFLKVCSGVLEPVQGSVECEGTVGSLTDITMGMDAEVSGYENIRRRGMFMGITSKKIKELTPEIADFSELGEFLNLPLRTYSTGMYLRLAFSISTTLTPEILIMDELISAGDANFVDKARNRLDEMMKKARILVLASHDMNLLSSLCNTGLLLSGGSVVFQGEIDKAIEAYQAMGKTKW